MKLWFICVPWHIELKYLCMWRKKPIRTHVWPYWLCLSNTLCRQYFKRLHVNKLWETYTTNVSPKNLKVIIFLIRLYLTIYSALLSLPQSTDLVVYWLARRTLILGSRVRASAEPTFMLISFFFYWWIVFIELFRYILKLIPKYSQFIIATTINCLGGLLVSVTDSYFGVAGSSLSRTDFYVDFFFLLMDSVYRTI